MTSVRPSIRVTRFDRLPADIELAMVTVIEREIALQRRLESLKRDLEIGLDYNAMSAFRSVDRYSSGAVNTSNLSAFLRTQGHFASEIELVAIIRRIDQDGDATVGYSEWADFLRPISGVSTVPVVGTIVDPVTTSVVERSYLIVHILIILIPTLTAATIHITADIIHILAIHKNLYHQQKLLLPFYS